jgi:hypothetical protein
VAVGKIVVFTSEMIRVEVEADHWLVEPLRIGDALQLRTKLFLTGNTQPTAEFADIHAIWHKDKGELIPPDHIVDDE